MAHATISIRALATGQQAIATQRTALRDLGALGVIDGYDEIVAELDALDTLMRTLRNAATWTAGDITVHVRK